jgi:class 3 adenylate cyclase/tetratricopeptide (TPR) repeat protein
MTRPPSLCPVCLGPTGEEGRFCRHCGVALPRPDRTRGAVDAGTANGEHKQVTVFCADLQGSLAIAEQVEPEDWHQIMAGLFAILAEAAERYGGTVSRFTGDGLMALFGAPAAQEDHAHRAGHAAIYARDALGVYADHLRRTRGLSFSVRIGLHSGQVVVSRFGDEPGAGFTAIGHTVGLAERMERLAKPGTIYLTDATTALVAGLFEVKDLGPFDLPGLPEPLLVRELVGRGTHRTRLEVSGARGFAPFVGRAEAMERLEAALADAQGGAGRVVEIVGQPGVGKSRLCHEFASACRRRGVRVVEWNVFSHLSSAPLLSLIEDFRHVLGVSPRDPADVARRKIARNVAAVDEGLVGSLPTLFDLLGLAEDRSTRAGEPTSLARELDRITERLAHAASRIGPTVVVLEDLHWIDATAARMLAAFLASTPSSRLLTLLTFRPEYRPPRPVPAERIDLGPLPTHEAAELVGRLLGPDPSTLEVAQRILERAGGNPFFLEEIVRSLAAGGFLDGERAAFRLIRPADRVRLPATLEASLGERIDRLGPHEKRVLHTAAVIGQEVSMEVLRSVFAPRDAAVTPVMTSLERGGFLARVGGPEAERFRFSHPLMREAAYGEQLGEVRMRTHAAVARALAEVDRDRVDERAALIAQHWERAGERLDAARWTARSARWMAARRVTGALASWRRVVEFLRGRGEPEALRLGVEARIQILELGARVGLEDADGENAFAEGYGLAAQLADPCVLARLSSAYAQLRGLHGDFDAAVEHAQRGLSIALETGEPGLVRDLQAALAFGYLAAGRFSEARALAEHALVSSRPVGPCAAGVPERPLGHYLQLFHAAAGVGLGQITDARREIEAVVAAADAEGQGELFCLATAFSTVVTQLVGDDPAAALDRARRAAALAADLESPYTEILTRWACGLAELLCGHWDLAERTIGDVLDATRRHGVALQGEAAMLTNLAEIALGRGEPAIAIERARTAVEVARRRRTGLFEGLALLVLVRARAMTGADLADAEIGLALARIREIIRTKNLPILAPFVPVAEALAIGSRGEATVRS